MSVTQAQIHVRKSILSRIKNLFAFSESGVLLALVVFSTAMYIMSPVFRQPYNMTIILKQISVTAVVAMGQTLVITSGGFDISQGSIVGLVAMLTGASWQRWGLPPVVAIFVGLGIGSACGLFNGVLSARLALHPMVVTLATGTVYMGFNYFVTKGRPIVRLSEGLLWLGSGKVGGFPVLFLVALVVTILMYILLTRTLFGLRVRMIGGNRDAARATGINVERIWIVTYTISGFLSALGGIIMLGRLRNAVPEMGSELLFPVVTAVIIGGTAFEGGVGTMLGTLMGTGIMGIVRNAMVVLEFDIYIQDAAHGGFVVLALVIDQFRRGRLSWARLIGRER